MGQNNFANLTICLVIFQNNSMDFQVLPNNKSVNCTHL